MMDIDRFWELVEQTRQRQIASPRDDDGFPELDDEGALTETLSELTPEEIVQFDRRFGERMLAAYHWDLWGAYDIIEESCAGDDAFEHFRAELILLGRQVFEAALADADSLADVSPLPWGDEGLIYVPLTVYEQKTGESLPYDENLPPFPSHPAGEPWEEKDLAHRLPRLWALYGDALQGPT